MPRQEFTKRADGRHALKCDGHFFYGKTVAEATRKRGEYIRERDRGYSAETSHVTYWNTRSIKLCWKQGRNSRRGGM